ncbi:uncharacterized protein LOC142333192 isoform X1 [Lycorma delicatula]|uniref:uncharacterized protein LOC142333192 isoform X1 n=1 Tax=Lycorma delicatula TaxID=130591 RepID=UPI003F50D5B9
MIDILAGLSWTSHPHIISMSSTEQSIQHYSVVSVSQNSNQDPESRLMSIIDELCNQQGTQPYIDIKFLGSDDELTSQTGEVIAFTCGHRYDGNTALEKAALGAAHALNQIIRCFNKLNLYDILHVQHVFLVVLNQN